MGGEDTGLYVERAAVGDAVAEDGMLDRVVHSPFVGCDDGAAAVPVELAAAGAADEVARAYLGVVDDLDGGAVGDQWPELLGEVEREGGAP